MDCILTFSISCVYEVVSGHADGSRSFMFRLKKRLMGMLPVQDEKVEHCLVEIELHTPALPNRCFLLHLGM